MHKLNTATVQSARRREHVRTTGAGQDARLQRAAGRGVDAQVERGHRAIRAKAKNPCPAPLRSSRNGYQLGVTPLRHPIIWALLLYAFTTRAAGFSTRAIALRLSTIRVAWRPIRS